MTPPLLRLRARVRGLVQGVGFRPHVHRIAQGLSLAGWVRNDPEGVSLEIEGPRESIGRFLQQLEKEAPPHAHILGIETKELPACGTRSFEILASLRGPPVKTQVLPDLAPCPDCLRELFDPSNRRFRHPFLSCIHCGPRYSILLGLPYDRPFTTLAAFELCPACQMEYTDPSDRRFHAQPIACPACGPVLHFHGRKGEDALQAARELLRGGGILALKGVGGFQLLVDATNEVAVRRLRARKHRDRKPFALMFPDTSALLPHVGSSPAAELLLTSAAAPIVLLPLLHNSMPWIAPGLREWGVMLPSSPLHHLLLEGWTSPIVATSGNLSEDPICIDNQEARERLGGIADAFLDHDRPIARPIDDSVARIINGHEQVLRRARGYAPLPIELPRSIPPTLALGSHLKNTLAIGADNHVFLSQHLGDLETPESCHAFSCCLDDLPRLLEITPQRVLHDLHPDYHSTRTAANLPLPRKGIPHHEAHAWACHAENGLQGPALAIVWDGAGYAPDQIIRGGEAFLLRDHHAEHAASLLPFPLPGGDQAARDPRRAALGALFACMQDSLTPDHALLLSLRFPPCELPLLLHALRHNLNSPPCSSMGRLFDAVAALAGLRLQGQYEGEAAMLLEHLSDPPWPANPTPLPFLPGVPLLLDWRPAILEFTDQLAQGLPLSCLSTHWHQRLAATVLALAQHFGIPDILLSGGCFQNRLLTECCMDTLAAHGFSPYIHHRVPPNDGGIAYGQIAAAFSFLAP